MLKCAIYRLKFQVETYKLDNMPPSEPGKPKSRGRPAPTASTTASSTLSLAAAGIAAAPPQQQEEEDGTRLATLRSVNSGNSRARLADVPVDLDSTLKQEEPPEEGGEDENSTTVPRSGPMEAVMLPVTSMQVEESCLDSVVAALPSASFLNASSRSRTRSRSRLISADDARPTVAPPHEDKRLEHGPENNEEAGLEDPGLVKVMHSFRQCCGSELIFLHSDSDPRIIFFGFGFLD
jgi:hypothetical protein